MTVDGNNRPAKANILLSQGAKRHNLVCGAINLQAITVNNINQIAQFIFSGKHCRFPNSTFLMLAIRSQTKRITAGVAQGKAGGKGEALTKRTGRVFNSGNIGRNVTLEAGVKLGISRQIAGGKITLTGKDGIKSGGKVAGGEDKMIFFKIKEVGKIEGNKQIEAGEGAANVAAIEINHIQNIEAQIFCDRGKRVTAGRKEHIFSIERKGER